ncbi:MAG: helix-turn-helix domain-containing protein [Enterocloster sp.]
MGQMLTVKQVAEVKGCRVQYIQRMAKEGKLPSVKTVNNRNQKVYQIPLESLPDELQQRWYQMQVEQMREENGIEEENRGGTDQFSAEERLEIDFWLELVRKWQEYRNLAPRGARGNRPEVSYLVQPGISRPDHFHGYLISKMESSSGE